MNTTFPRAPAALSDDMARLVVRLAELWAQEPVRPQPARHVLRYWERLIAAWAEDASLPLYVRKADNNRGSLVPHPSGRQIVPSDNSPAQWAFALALLGEMPALEDIRQAIAADRIPVAIVLNTAEKPAARFRCTLRKVVNPNSLGWKVAHVESVGLAGRTPLSQVAEVQLHQHFCKLMTPANMFLIPLPYAGLAELPEFCDAIKTLIQAT